MAIDNTPFSDGSYLTSGRLNNIVDSIKEVEDNKVSLPTEGSGTIGDFAISDGQGGISWKTISFAEEESF